jgi:hypothetical protein
MEVMTMTTPDLQLLRDSAAERYADTWRAIAEVVDHLRGPHWASAFRLGKCVAEGETFAEWAARHPGATVPIGEHRVTIADDGRAVTVHAASPPVGGHDTATTILIDHLHIWQPPERPRYPWTLALAGRLSEAELLDLAASDPLAAACSPNATTEVLEAAGARLVADTDCGTLALLVSGHYVTAGAIRGMTADQIRELAMRLWPKLDLARLPVVGEVRVS